MGRTTQVLADGIYFGEGPRWHEGRLWFSDFYAKAVKSVSLAGDLRAGFEGNSGDRKFWEILNSGEDIILIFPVACRAMKNAWGRAAPLTSKIQALGIAARGQVQDFASSRRCCSSTPRWGEGRIV